MEYRYVPSSTKVQPEIPRRKDYSTPARERFKAAHRRMRLQRNHRRMKADAESEMHLCDLTDDPDAEIHACARMIRYRRIMHRIESGKASMKEVNEICAWWRMVEASFIVAVSDFSKWPSSKAIHDGRLPAHSALCTAVAHFGHDTRGADLVSLLARFFEHSEDEIDIGAPPPLEYKSAQRSIDLPGRKL